MKAKEVRASLKYPFCWQERRPLLMQRALFVPNYYDKHAENWHFPGWEDPSFFGKAGKIFIEYCSGNGNWIIEKAAREKDCHWLAVEKKFERARQIWAKIHTNELQNLVVVSGEALTFSKYYLPDDSVDGAYINFPDPWPKLKHAKHRLLRLPFIEEMARIMKKGAAVTIVTDDKTYVEQIIREMDASHLWKSAFDAPYFITEWEGYGNSYFETLWRKKERTIHYLKYIAD